MSTGVPVTIWRNTNGLTEFSNDGVFDIIDTLSINLIDTTGLNIIDTGVIATLIPSTTWEEDDSI